jgi:hypothetical protein
VTGLEIVQVLWLAGWLATVFTMWRERRFVVQLPWHGPDEWQCHLAIWYARIFLSAGWPVLLFIEGLIHRRKEQR